MLAELRSRFEAVAPRERRSDPPDWGNRLPVFGQQDACGSCGLAGGGGKR